MTDSSVWVRQAGREVVTLVDRSNTTERYEKSCNRKGKGIGRLLLKNFLLLEGREVFSRVQGEGESVKGQRQEIAEQTGQMD